MVTTRQRRRQIQQIDCMIAYTTSIALDEHYITGLADIDAQHLHLSGLVHQLHAHCTNCAPQDHLLHTLSELKNYTAFHFKNEEELLDNYAVNPVNKALHIQAHRDFIDLFERLCTMADTHPEMVAALLLAYCTQWRMDHMTTLDRIMAAEILSSQSGETPESMAGMHHVQPNQRDNAVTPIYRYLNNHALSLLEENIRLRTIADHAHSWEYWEGLQGEIIYMSPACERITGYPPAKFMQDPDLLYRLVHPEDRAALKAHQHDFRLTADNYENELEIRIVRPDGDIRWILHSCRAMHNAQGQLIGRHASNRENTARHAGSDMMLLVASVFDAVNEAVVLTDEDGRIILANASFTKITEYQPQEIVGQLPNFLAARKKSPEALLESWQTRTGTGRWEAETTYRRKNGETYIAATSIDCVRDETGQITNFLLVFSDISDKKASERKLHYLAHYDQLTGLPNWVLFNDRLRQALSSAKRSHQMIALMFIDIDHFKTTKDQIGHEKSDLLVQELAKRILRCIRDSDTAARIGNDEFSVLLNRIKEVTVISNVADQILASAKEPFTLKEESIHISVSIGIAVYPEHGVTAEELMRHADLATYQAKQSGGFTAALYSNMNDWEKQMTLW